MIKSIKLWSVVFAFVLFSGGCQKEITPGPELNTQALRATVTKPFKMNAKTWYRISPTTPAPVPGMAGQISFANVPGGGWGTATQMGNIGTWFNQLAYSPDGQQPPAGTIAAPLHDAHDYPVVYPGAPLPLIQPNDFAPLEIILGWLQLPAEVDGHVVWSVLYNHRGDAVFLSTTTPSTTVVESATRINFSGDGIFVGGRGKFENARGTYHFTGFFNPRDANDAGYSIDGSITH